MLRLIRTLSSLFIIGIILYGVLSIRPYRVDGDSMMPNLKPESITIIDRISPKIFPLRRGEIIVYRSGDGVKIKRVIGLPGEVIQISDGIVSILINSTQNPLEERYLEEHMRTCVPGACTELGIQLYSVPESHYFVLGDNRINSRDSR